MFSNSGLITDSGVDPESAQNSVSNPENHLSMCMVPLNSVDPGANYL